MFFCVLAPEQASAQLFRGWQGDNSRSNTSNLPGANPNARPAPGYGAELVSEAIRNEVNGYAPVRPAPDLRRNTALSLIIKQSLPPESYVVQRPFGDDSRVQPPLTKYAGRIIARPHWIAPYAAPTVTAADASDLAPELNHGDVSNGSANNGDASNGNHGK